MIRCNSSWEDFEFVRTTQKTTFERIYLLCLEFYRLISGKKYFNGLHEQWIFVLRNVLMPFEVPEDGWNRFYFSMV
ncbi:hypothetical protein RCL_jg26355.t1 [Rhizophagus clarus]|uniref:Uncharacterized protein n=1 Tax=Rhizophagus clarus TaxID=94130 RepID=A0A8H3KYX9_9GLOM|nr:hypothetical protein RCL_jg26355.t1 [Rhizophagus clarus]